MSTLGDLIVEHGPYGPYEVERGFKHLPLTDEAELNALRDELIELRAKADREGRVRRVLDHFQPVRRGWTVVGAFPSLYDAVLRAMGRDR